MASDIHRDQVGNGDNERHSNTSFGGRRRRVSRPTPKECHETMSTLHTKQKLGNIHYQREQTPVSRNDQVHGKIRKNVILLRVYGQNHISDNANHRGTHDMVPPVPSLVAVPGLDPDDDHAYKIGSNSETLGLNRAVAEFADEL